jgi:DNA-binding winged helix-turn-helix (wHTH) protein
MGDRPRVLVLTLDDLEAATAPPEPRFEPSQPLPTIDEYGLLRHGTRWVSLTPTEERVLRVLLERVGRVCSRTLLTDAGWPRGPANERILDTYVRRLRAKIPAFGIEIRTVRKRGFLLDVEGAAVES